MKEDFLPYRDVLERCGLFQGMDGQALDQALQALNARVVRLEKGRTLYRPGDVVREASVVLEGLVMIEADDSEGDRTSLNVLGPGEDFGACLVIARGAKSPMHVYAGRSGALMMLDIARIQQMDLREGPARLLYNNVMESVADRCVELYGRVQIYGKKRVRARIRMYLMMLAEKDGSVELPLNRTALAAYLGVDRTALARELGRMQEDGLIAVSKRRVRLLDREFF